MFSETSPAAPGTVAGAVQTLGGLESLSVTAELVGATGGVLDVYLQDSNDGINFTDYAHFAQLGAAASAVVKRFTVSRGAQQATITTVGRNLSPALAANTVVGGNFGKFVRMLYVAGASTTAGAVLNFTLDGMAG